MLRGNASDPSNYRGLPCTAFFASFHRFSELGSGFRPGVWLGHSKILASSWRRSLGGLVLEGECFLRVLQQHKLVFGGAFYDSLYIIQSLESLQHDAAITMFQHQNGVVWVRVRCFVEKMFRLMASTDRNVLVPHWWCRQARMFFFFIIKCFCLANKGDCCHMPEVTGIFQLFHRLLYLGRRSWSW